MRKLVFTAEVAEHAEEIRTDCSSQKNDLSLCFMRSRVGETNGR